MALSSGLLHTIVGPNGSGKTTLIKLLSFLDRPTKGTITFRGRPINKDKPVPQQIRRSVSLVMQDHYLFDGSVSSNVSYGLRVRRMGAPLIEQSVKSALEAVGLAGFEQRRGNTLSGGESKRVAIARAVALSPEVLLLDEPTANIDKRNSEMIEEIIVRLKSEGITIIMTTHDFSQACRLSDNMISLVTGRIVDASPENIFPCNISHQTATLSSGLTIHVATSKSGRAHIAIDPDDILLSLGELKSSARNSIQGIIRRILIEDSLVKVYVDVGTEFASVITRDSLEKLALSPGVGVYLTFKANSVRVL
ncbi:MAG: ABC transporter ATP-binding protein [bacterium]